VTSTALRARRRVRACVAAVVASLPLAVGAQPPALGAADARLAVGFGVVGVAVAPFDRAVAERLQRPDLQGHRGLGRTAFVFRRYAQPVLLVAMPALWAGGRLAGDDGTAEAGLRATEAIGAGLVVTGAVKLLSGRARPYVPGRDPGRFALLRGLREGSDYSSFVSGHTTVAFAAASALAAHAARTGGEGGDRWAVGVPLYAAAGLAGLSRMYEDRHWASDVVGGALVGTVAGGAVVRWHAARPGSRVDRWLLGARLQPAVLGVPAWERAAGGGAPAPALLILPR
jgi:membrane-associated phospholipid phosphatase